MRPATAELPILRREPAAILGFIQAALVLAVTLGAHLSGPLQAAILSATGAVLSAITAWKVAPTRPALTIGVVQTLIPLAVLIGLHMPPGAGGAILALVAAALALLTRSQVSPAAAGPPPAR